MLFFNLEPHKFFRGAFSEIVIYNDYDGIKFTEKTFRGALYKQIKNVLQYLKSVVLTEKVIKVPDQAEAIRIWNYPYEAVEEAVVNAFYHRSYENVNPIEISVYPDKMMILSFPGPLPPINKEMLKKRKVFTRDYRNRRIGDFLKELDLTEGRGTGFPIIYQKMEQNGSPNPVFETDDAFTNFLTVLPIHPVFLEVFNKEEEQKDEFNELTTSEKVLVLIRENSKITKKEISERISISLVSVKRIISKLVSDNKVKRTGTKKSGEWMIQ
jgi:ATP-dependent DNA helicase RecG